MTMESTILTLLTCRHPFSPCARWRLPCLRSDALSCCMLPWRLQFLMGTTAGCWVSEQCYKPPWLVDAWIAPQLAALPNLQVLLRTVVRSAVTGADGALQQVTVVQRSPRVPSTEWSTPLSGEIQDWYSPHASSTFTKRVINITAGVFIEATEFGDVFVTAGLNMSQVRSTAARSLWLHDGCVAASTRKSPCVLPAASQGVEIPTEASFSTDDTCGQMYTYPFFVTYAAVGEPVPVPPVPVPPGTAGVDPFGFAPNYTWTQVCLAVAATSGGAARLLERCVRALAPCRCGRTGARCRRAHTTLQIQARRRNRTGSRATILGKGHCSCPWTWPVRRQQLASGPGA